MVCGFDSVQLSYNVLAKPFEYPVRSSIECINCCRISTPKTNCTSTLKTKFPYRKLLIQLPIQSGNPFPIICRSSLPLAVPGMAPDSSASSTPQIPNRRYPHNEPNGRP